jgi:hypothetical protein
MATWTDHDPKPEPSQRLDCEPVPPAPRWVAVLLPWLYPAAELTDGPCAITTEAEAQ